jgi:hypothetical protein
MWREPNQHEVKAHQKGRMEISLSCQMANYCARIVRLCYGRLAVVSDLDDGGFALNVRQGVERICHAISKQVQWSDARIKVDVMHTWNECTE